MKYYDNTRIDAQRTCPRYNYFRHVRHWRREGKNVDFAFGSGWHAAMDIVWTLAKHEMPDTELHKVAFAAFAESWIADGFPAPADITPEVKEELGTKTPGVALEMLWAYIQQRRPLLRKIELLAAERPFAVLIDPTDTSIMYVGRIDKEFRNTDGYVYCGEHKTTGLYRKDGHFSQEWMELFNLSPQVAGYNHKIHMDYGQAAKGTWIDAALVHKTVHDAFRFIPIERRLEDMDSWWFDTISWIREIEKDKADLEAYRADPNRNKDYMPAFKKNTKNCMQYMKLCSYFDLCKFRGNPELIQATPPGFIVEEWNPIGHLNLASIGIKEE